MKFQPHKYQEFAINFILNHPECAVFLDMGLGKTSITLTAVKELLDRGEIHRVLVIAPVRVAKNTWPDEIGKWDHLNGLSCSVAVGTAKQRSAAVLAETQICTIGRENVDWLIEKSGLPFNFDMVVVDELSSFKSWQAKRFKALLGVRPYLRRIVGLTGTPAPNGLMDLFAEMKVIDGGKRLGRYITHYREQFFKPDRMDPHTGIVFSYKPLPGAEDEIYRLIGDITISMKATDHLNMPELVSVQYPVDMDADERDSYETMKHDMVLSSGDVEVTASNAATLCLKLSQMANGALWTEDKASFLHIHDRKLDALEDLVEAANGKPVLVAYWFKHDFSRIMQRFPEIARSIKSPEDIHDWNNGRILLGLIHPASAGHGLNLQQGGNTLVWFGLTWSLELYQQTNARLWRQGQKQGTVVIQHIITRRTVDERIMDALEHKDMKQETLIRAVKAQLGEDPHGGSRVDKRAV